MYKQFYSVKTFFILLLLSIGIGNNVNSQTVEVLADNNTTWGDGSRAKAGDILHYYILTFGGTGSNLTNSTVYGKIPAGTVYVAGSTIVNGVAVSDINGRMPFASGGLVNSSTQAPGVIASGQYVVIEYEVKVGGNYGNLSNYATLKAAAGSSIINVKSNTLSSSITTDAVCSNIYQVTPSASGGGTPYRLIRTLNTTNGTGSSTVLYNGFSGSCYNAVSGVALPNGSVLTDGEAMAYTRSPDRLYFINGTTNNPAQDLCYVDVVNSPAAAYKYVGYPLETNTGAGYNIDRMAFCADGYGYALTENNLDLIRFYVDNTTNLLVISRLGALVNDVNNGSNDVLAETGGDIFSDGSGRMYLVPDSRKLYMINPATGIATYLGTITVSGTSTTGVTSVTTDLAGNVYMGGAYNYAYKVSLATMTGAPLNTITTNVYKTGDYSSCAFPILAPVLNVTKSYTNTSGADHVQAGDPIEYTIEVTNTGNINAALVKLYDAIPANSYYVAGSTTINGVAVSDIGGAMPFSVTGGQYINSSSESTGIVRVGSANKVVIKFRVTTAAFATVCNQSIVTCTDGLGGILNAFSDDPAQPGSQDITCFYSDGPIISMKANKTFINTTGRTFNGAVYVLPGDPIEYTIEVTNTGNVNAAGVKFYDAIPTYSHYVASSTKMNGVAVTDIGGVMPFAVSGGSLINSLGESAGVVAPGDTNKVVIKFRVRTDPLKNVCNQGSVIFTDGNGITKNVSTDDPTQTGTQDSTCFWSDGVLGRIAVNGTTNKGQSNTVEPILITSVQVQPNPFINDLNLRVELPTTETIQVRLIDFYGRTVYTASRNVGAGVNSLKVSVPGLSRGVYVLEVLAGRNRLISKKLIRQ